MFWKEVSYVVHQDCIYLIKNTDNCFLFVYVFKCVGKAKFSAAITPVFSVTWSFRNHSNMLICCSKNYTDPKILNSSVCSYCPKYKQLF